MLFYLLPDSMKKLFDFFLLHCFTFLPLLRYEKDIFQKIGIFLGKSNTLFHTVLPYILTFVTIRKANVRFPRLRESVLLSVVLRVCKAPVFGVYLTIAFFSFYASKKTILSYFYDRSQV